ncbi:MAG: pseudouridine synthase [Phycisphaerales bacterium]
MSEDGTSKPAGRPSKPGKKVPGGPLAARKVAVPVRAAAGARRGGPDTPNQVGEFTRRFGPPKGPNGFSKGPRGFDKGPRSFDKGADGPAKPWAKPGGKSFGPRATDGPRPRSQVSLGPGVNIIYQDGDVLVLEKPSGILTAGQKGEVRETLFDRVKQFVRSTSRPVLRRDLKASKEKGLPRHAAQGVWVVHRLDKEASGLLVFATSVRGFEVLKNDFKAKRVHRIYTALVEGEVGPIGHSGTIQSFLKEDEEGNVRSLASDEFRGPDATGALGDPDTAKLAVTHFKVVALGNGCSLLHVRLETGRKNQIRVHMASKGHPLVGDLRYGAKSDPGRRLCLHASELGFNHPGTGLSVRYSCPAPAAFYDAVGAKAPPQPTRTQDDGHSATPASSPAPRMTAKDTSWQQVADWYDDLISGKTNDHYEMVILPGVLRLAQPIEAQRVLDLACGQGMITGRLAELGADVLGIDAAPALIEAASSRTAGAPSLRFIVGDAVNLAAAGVEPCSFDLALCVMGLTNLDPLSPVFEGLARALKPGGRVVAVIQHPGFRTPDQSSWGWDDAAKKQYRRVDGYLSSGHKAITMNPGAVARGEKPVTTLTFHRPIQAYIKHLVECGFTIDALEEWPAQRVSTSGPRAAEENRSRAEIPLFLALRAIKVH